MARVKMVLQRPETIRTLTHSQRWASDAEINKGLEERYAGYDYLYCSDEFNAVVFRAKIRSIKEKYDKLYETTLYEYNPIENYDLKEHETTTGENDSTSTSSGKAFALNTADAGHKVGDSENIGHNEGTSERDLTRHGNVGIMSTQQMIMQERSIIITLLADYIEEFSDCFDLSI